MKKPIVLLALANDVDKSLRLEEEETAVRTALTAAHDQNRIEYHSLSLTTLDEIYRAFNRFHNRIAVFHYGGHSDAEFLKLHDRNARASGLSVLMGMQRELKLVFLNGCANQQHLTELFDQGVRVVIATRAAIDDSRATALATQFYEALAAGKTIREAFDTATSYLEHDPAEEPTASRGLLDEEADAFPWDLYTNPAHDDADLTWCLPDPVEPREITEEAVALPWQELELNRELVELTFEGMATYLPATYEAPWNAYNDTPSGAQFNVLQNLLLEAFPSIISIQIRDLFSPPGKSDGRVRLLELSEVYLALGRFLSAVALSDLWNASLNSDTLLPNPNFEIRDEYREDLRRFLRLSSPQQAASFDYFWVIDTAVRIFEDNQGATPYAKELIELAAHLRQSEAIYEAYRFLEQELRLRLLARDVATEDVEALCIDAEHHLGVLLQQCAFLSAYQLVTIKDIGVHLPRRSKEPVFLHNKSILRGYDYVNMDQSPLERLSTVNNNSIYLAREIKTEAHPLNLSPFLIDENAFKIKPEPLPKLHFLDYISENALHFKHAATLREGFVLPRTFESPSDKRTFRRTYKDVAPLLELLTFFETDLKLT